MRRTDTVKGEFKKCRNPSCGRALRQNLIGRSKFYCDAQCRHAHHNVQNSEQYCKKLGALNLMDFPEVEKSRPLSWQHLTSESFVALSNRLLDYVDKKEHMPLCLE